MKVNYTDLDLEIEGVSPNGRNLIRRLLFESPNMRPTIEEVLEHPFLNEDEVWKHDTTKYYEVKRNKNRSSWSHNLNQNQKYRIIWLNYSYTDYSV